MGIFSDLISGGIGGVIKAVGDVASDLITTDKEKMAAQIELEKIGVDREKAYLADTDSARKMQIAALSQDDLFSKRFVYFFTAAWSLFSMGFFIAVTFANIPEKNIRFVDTLLGFLLGTAIASIFNFFLGTTQSSRHKDETIKALSDQK